MIKKLKKLPPLFAKSHRSPKTDDKQGEDKERKNYNLFILGLISIAIAVCTTTISLKAYHDSGDIYLDRSRPGFLPDEKEVEEQQEQKRDYAFSSDGELNEHIIDEYLENYKQQLEALDKLERPFSSKPLSDESLGINPVGPETDE